MSACQGRCTSGQLHERERFGFQELRRWRCGRQSSVHIESKPRIVPLKLSCFAPMLYLVFDQFCLRSRSYRPRYLDLITVTYKRNHSPNLILTLALTELWPPWPSIPCEKGKTLMACIQKKFFSHYWQDFRRQTENSQYCLYPLTAAVVSHILNVLYVWGKCAYFKARL